MSTDRPIVPGYVLEEALHVGHTRVVHRGREQGGDTPVIVKTWTDAVDLATATGELRREAEILQSLSVEGVPELVAVELRGTRPALVVQDLGGAPLTTVVRSGVLGLVERVTVALRLTAIVGRLHEAGVIHCDINPSNVLLDGATLRVAVVDFGLAGTRAQSDPKLDDGSLLGTPAYMSPEQTGRTSWPVDHRADLYSLGATLYELLTGQLPFEGTDPLKIVHAHLALEPRPLEELNPRVPPVLAAVVHKLLHKSPDERYQTARALETDLATILDELRTSGTATAFPIARGDRLRRLAAPERLYGRERELAALHEAFERALGNAGEVLLVAGYSGIGKTTLVDQLRGVVAGCGGRFIAGKFDQVARGTPYSAIRQAFGELAREMLMRPDDEVARTKERLERALGVNGRVLVELVPEFGAVLGPQPDVADLGPAEAQNRFNRLFREFLRSLARKDEPLVLFLDDIQWMDSASMDLIRVALSDWNAPGLMVVGAYRDNEVDEGHPLVSALDEVEASGTRLSRMALTPLDEDALARLVSDALGGGYDHGAPIADIVAAKTGGNPFFVTQFMTLLAEERLLVADPESGVWKYDLAEIRRQPSTDNVVEVIVTRIGRLPQPTIEALKVAACLGGRFETATLALAMRWSEQETRASVTSALREGLLVEHRDDSSDYSTQGYRFLHDRVQQAAHALIPVDARPAFHLEIARALLDALPEDAKNERAFELIDLVRPGVHLVTEQGERRAFFNLAFAAGEQARAGAAWGEALDYLQLSAGLLPSKPWSKAYQITFDVHLGIAESQYLSGRFEDGFRTLDLLSTRAASPIDKARAQIVRAAQHETMADYGEAVEALRLGLVGLGIDFPRDDGFDAELERELDATESALGDREIAGLVELPVLDDPAIKMSMRLLAFAWAPSYLRADLRMISWIPAKMVQLSLEHGNTEESALGYVVHGFTLGTRRGEYRAGNEFGRLGIQLNDRFGDIRLRGKVHELFGCFVKPWRSPLRDCIESQRTAFLAGTEGGDFAYGSYGGFVETWYAVLTCDRLEGLDEAYEPVMEFLRSIKNRSFEEAERLILNWASALGGRTQGPTSLVGAGFSEEDFLAGFGQAPFFRVFYDIVKLHLHLTLGETDEARRYAAGAGEVAHSVTGTIWQMLLRFYRTMAIAASTGRGQDPSPEDGAVMAADSEQMAKWAENCPENFAHADLLIRAELARIAADDTLAQDLFSEAISAAHTRGFPADLGLANERFARYWLERGQERIATFFLFEALAAYDSWGARPKVQQLGSELAERIDRSDGVAPLRQLTGPGAVLGTIRSSADALDSEWALQAAGAMASEIELDGLLRTLMRTLLESGGAERGGLVLRRDDNAILRVWGDAGRGDITLRSVPLDDAEGLSHSIVRYVCRTSSTVVVGDASSDPAYASDPYVLACSPRSILCVPITYQKQTLGAVYLENNLERGAFGGARLRLLETLSTNAAIAIRNADLFEENARLEERLRAENVYLHEAMRTSHEFEDIIGDSPPLIRVLEQVEQVAPTDSTVLILGETGTGKELLARAIHARGSRSDRPLVTVNCAAISPGLIESELFGHEKGSFTGATARKIGRFELAHEGTLFLDEIGDLALELQVKLLRVLQEGEIQRVGGTASIPVDVRVMAGTHHDLQKAIRDGDFRADLFYRLHVFPIHNPPLRERTTDIPKLVRHFVMKDGARLGKRLETIPKRTMDALVSYEWPGNVRELRNVIERSIITSPGPSLELGNWLPATSEVTDLRGDRTLDEVQRDYIAQVLQSTGWVVSGAKGAAVRLGLKPTTLEARMKKLGIHRPT